MQLLKYGLKDGKLIHINDVSNGLSCGCTCPSCGEVLEAHQGQKNQYHFKHYNVKDCNHGSESALHIMAKRIIADSKCVYVPNIPLKKSKSYNSNSKGGEYFYNRSYIEKVITSDLRCDVLLENIVSKWYCREPFRRYEPNILNVEIKVTHKVDFEKRLKLYNENLETIEIDLSDFVNDFDENKIRKIITSGEKTELIYSPACRDFYAKKLLGNFEKISYDRRSHIYLKKCMCTNSNEKTYLCPYGGYPDGANNICLYQKGLSERDFWCMGLYGDLDCTTVDKIIQVKRKKQIVQYAEIIVNGERRAYSNNSSCPYFSKKSDLKSDLIGKKFFHQDYGELTIIGVNNSVPNKTIIRVQHLNGETSQMNWDILHQFNKIKTL